MKKSYRWDNLSSPAIRAMAAQEAIVLIPLGSTEQHGPHLPVGTDAILATFFAEEAAKKLNEMGKPCLVAPTIAPANSMHHMNFAGSISLEPQTYMNQLQEICRAIARHGFRRIDEIPLPAGAEKLEILVAGYNITSYYLVNEPAFLCAEILDLC